MYSGFFIFVPMHDGRRVLAGDSYGLLLRPGAHSFAASQPRYSLPTDRTQHRYAFVRKLSTSTSAMQNLWRIQKKIMSRVNFENCVHSCIHLRLQNISQIFFGKSKRMFMIAIFADCASFPTPNQRDDTVRKAKGSFSTKLQSVLKHTAGYTDIEYRRKYPCHIPDEDRSFVCLPSKANASANTATKCKDQHP